MKKTFLSIVCIVVMFSACQKIALKDPSTNLISKSSSSDTIKVIPPVAATNVVVPAVGVSTTLMPGVVGSTVVMPGVVGSTTMMPGVVGSTVVMPGVAGTSGMMPGVVGLPVVMPGVGGTVVMMPPVLVPPGAKTPPVVTPPVVVPIPVVKPPVAVTPPVVIPPMVGLSFMKDIMPLLTQCNNCHMHGWTSSSVASTFYANMGKQGYIMPTTYTSSMIYTKLMSGHNGMRGITSSTGTTGTGMMSSTGTTGMGMMSSNSNTGFGMMTTTNINMIVNWMKQGSLNN